MRPQTSSEPASSGCEETGGEPARASACNLAAIVVLQSMGFPLGGGGGGGGGGEERERGGG